MNGKGSGGRGRGQGQGGSGKGFGRMGGGRGLGPSGYCICPACGHRESHQRGVPCIELRCPKCGTAMVRE